MFATLLPSLLGKVFDVIDKSIPDKNKAAELKAEVARQDFDKWNKELEAMMQINQAQSAVNLADAQSQDWFQRRWRPFIGWGCGIAFLWNTAGIHITNAFITWTVVLGGQNAETIALIKIPAADSDMMFELLLMVLGLGGMRTFERIKGKA